jgi:dihydrofolate reductase
LSTGREGASSGPACVGVTYYVAASLDGRIAREDGSLDWLSMDQDYGFHEFFATVDAVVMGRKTFDFIVGHGTWPYGERPGRILSRGGVGSPFPEARVTSAAPGEVVESLRRDGHERIWLVGGGVTARDFLELDLLDRIAVYTMPVILGGGPPMLPGGSPESRWDLSRQRTFGSGVVELVYDRRR